MEPEERIKVANEANYILTHPLVRKAFEDIETTLNNALTDAPEKDLEGIKNLVLTKKCLKRFKAAFQRHIETGKIAERELVQRKPLLKRIF